MGREEEPTPAGTVGVRDPQNTRESPDVMVVTALASEGRAARRGIARCRDCRPFTHGVGVYGPGRASADRLRDALADPEIPLPHQMLIVGYAGGCVDGLEPGDVVPAGTCSLVGHDNAGEPNIQETVHLTDASGPGNAGHLVTVWQPLTDPAGKRRLASRCGADAVDMETYHLVRSAQSAGIPVDVIRVISDPVNCAIPPGLPGVIDAAGGVAWHRLAWWGLTHARDWPALRTLAGHARRADRAIAEHVQRYVTETFPSPPAGRD